MSQSKESSQEIGVYLHRLRKERKLTLKEVSVYLGIDVSTLSKIENGERQIQAYQLSSIAEFFNLDFRQLQIEFLMHRIHLEYGDQPYLKESLERYLQDK
jgi:transcriptional regulator with XRE-family HTH domain